MPQYHYMEQPKSNSAHIMIKLTNGMKSEQWRHVLLKPPLDLGHWVTWTETECLQSFGSYTTLSRLADTKTALRQMGQVEFSDSQRSMQCT